MDDSKENEQPSVATRSSTAPSSLFIQDTIDEIRFNADRMEKTLSTMRQEVLSLRDQLNVMKGEMNVMKQYQNNQEPIKQVIRSYISS